MSKKAISAILLATVMLSTTLIAYRALKGIQEINFDVFEADFDEDE